MATLTISDQTLARLRAVAAARQVSVEAYLDNLAAIDAGTASSWASGKFRESNIAERVAAADSIRKLATKVKGKATIAELIADKHAGHNY